MSETTAVVVLSKPFTQQCVVVILFGLQVGFVSGSLGHSTINFIIGVCVAPR